ncbi:MAG: nuclear transport factor 2 family protein, partial [Chloroflexi bacterium]|nr:nuclear transport factor 2 family protein [Chloroflexota bacterium]
MTESAQLQAAVRRLDDLEAIKRLKYKYIRCVDSKLWDELAKCFTEDATTSYEGGKYKLVGRDAIMDFFKRDMGPELITMHHVHHPEIEIAGTDAARG